MARKERIIFPGAMYHIIARTEDRHPVFARQDITEIFELYLSQLCLAHAWSLFAYTVLPDCVHLFVKTHDPDLPQGMKWLMANTAAAYNRKMNRNGHVFAGRYKSILVDDDPQTMLSLTYYLHAAPMRRNLTGIDKLHLFDGNSFRHYWSSSELPGLSREWLLNLAGIEQSKGCMHAYRDLMVQAPESDPEREQELQNSYCRGWFIGKPQTKLRLARKLAGIDPQAIWTGGDLRQLNEAKWQLVLERELQSRKIAKKQILQDPKGAAWKAEIACILRRETSAKNPWIAESLNMGHPNRVSMVLSEARKQVAPKRD